MQCSSCSRLFFSPKDYIRHAHQPQLSSEGKLHLNCDCGSPLELEPGTFSWFRHELFMSPEAAAYHNILTQYSEIPKINMASVDLKQALDKGDVSTEQLAQIGRSDAFIAGEVVKQANAARKESAMPAENLEQAIRMIGREKLAALCVSASIASIEIKTHVFSLKSYFYDSILTGLIAEELARRFRLLDHAPMAHTCAIHCNIGKILAAATLSTELDKVHNLSNEGGMDWISAEKQVKDLKHGLLGEIAGILWSLDIHATNVARYHHTTPEEGYLINHPAVHLAVFANQLCHIVSGRPHRIQKPIVISLSKLFDISQPDLHEVCRSIQGLKSLAQARSEAVVPKTESQTAQPA